MNRVTNYGTIEFNKELTPEAIEAVKKAFEPHADWYEDYLDCFEEGATDVELEEYSDKEMYGTLVTTVNALKPLGYVLNGCIEYYGDYGDGATYVNDNEVVEYDDQSRWHMDATDDDLIKELETRGYVTVKKKALSHNVEVEEIQGHEGTVCLARIYNRSDKELKVFVDDLEGRYSEPITVGPNSFVVLPRTDEGRSILDSIKNGDFKAVYEDEKLSNLDLKGGIK